MLFSKHNCIEIQYDNGKQSVIRRDAIYAVTGDAKTTTLVFQGGSIEIVQSIDNVLIGWYRQEIGLG